MFTFNEYFELLNEKLNSVNTELLEESVNLIKKTKKNGGKVIIVGNGGSAAMASHVAVDLTKNANIRAINFNEADLLTCFANDYGYEKWVEKALGFYADKNDLVILISSSGTSLNIVNAANFAKDNNLKLITLSGFSNKNLLNKLGDINLWVDSKGYNIIEMTHNVWLLAIVDKLIGRIEY